MTKTRRAFLLGCLAGAAFLLAALTVLNVSDFPDWLVKPLLRPDTDGAAEAIVVLGADYWEPCGWSVSSFRRTVHGVRLWRQGRAPILLFTGGPTAASRGEPVAAAMADLAATFGVPRHAIEIESRSRNTWENAVMTAERLRARGTVRVVVVTDGIHMRRAEASFWKAGLTVERSSVPQSCVSSSNLAMLRSAVHEYAGWVYYRLKGWVAAAPPAPGS
jgi:uncharacterized SAM-binding protein YcdF (DUF218 family)